jgi:hypothetical protein
MGAEVSMGTLVLIGALALFVLSIPCMRWLSIEIEKVGGRFTFQDRPVYGRTAKVLLLYVLAAYLPIVSVMHPFFLLLGLNGTYFRNPDGRYTIKLCWASFRRRPS